MSVNSITLKGLIYLFIKLQITYIGFASAIGATGYLLYDDIIAVRLFTVSFIILQPFLIAELFKTYRVLVKLKNEIEKQEK